MAKVADARARFAGVIADSPLTLAPTTSRAVEAYYDRVAVVYRERAEIYRLNRSRPGRFWSVVHLTSHGGYQSRCSGGLDGKSMLKDLYVALCR
jgi:hypothetical protein